jgi:hypothetical protein
MRFGAGNPGRLGERRGRLDTWYQTMRNAGAFDDDVVTGAVDAILFERARALLLDGAAAGDSL